MPLEAQVEFQFEDAARQKEVATLGMWVFLSTEVMFFSVLFTGYALSRSYFPVGFAQGSHHLTQWLGTLETADLLTASMLAALALHAIRHGHRARSTALLGLTALLGAGFLVMHGTEYAEHVHKGALPGRYFHMEEEQGVPGISMFFTCYWFLTVLHSFHVLCGVGVLLWMAWLTGRGRFGPAYHTPVELVALYWHFVDVVWVFLYPMFYLVK